MEVRARAWIRAMRDEGVEHGGAQRGQVRVVQRHPGDARLHGRGLRSCS